jgi:YidC/Oxa1 family membrane protein insertase
MQPGDVRQVNFDDTDTTEFEGAKWAGYRNRFWTLMVAGPGALSGRLATGEERRDARLELQAENGQWSFYLGPVEPQELKRAAPELVGMLYAGLWFWLRWICLGLFNLLAWIKLAVPSWGLAVMLLSLCVNILMLPLSRIADRFQQQVNETEARLAPELQSIKKNYKGEEQAAKILALYKTERVHPLYSLKSMLGVAVVIPVFIGAFDMLAENIHLLNTGFLWIADLSRPDDLFNLPFRLPFFGDEFNLLPLLMTGLSVVASALHKPLALNAELRGRQVRNMLLLAFAFFVLFYTFPAGMVLYWTTNNLISVIKSLWARR